MNVHAAALAKTHRFDEQTSAFASDVIDGLSQHPKRLSPKYFYDATGSELFEQITLLPEYYPTRTELTILRDRASEISAVVPKGAALVEFGAGATTKVRLLLNQCAFGAYVPVDISGDFLKAQADALRKDFPALGDAEARIFPGIDARKFRAARSLRLHAQRPRHPRRGRADDHRRRPRKERAGAV